MCKFSTGSGTITYETVRMAMNGDPFTMSLTDTDEINVVIEAVNGIDSHLEACYCPDRGDRFEGGTRRAGKFVLCRTLECVVSVESLPDGEVAFVPFAQMFNGNPYEAVNPPKPEGGYFTQDEVWAE